MRFVESLSALASCIILATTHKDRKIADLQNLYRKKIDCQQKERILHQEEAALQLSQHWICKNLIRYEAW